MYRKLIPSLLIVIMFFISTAQVYAQLEDDQIEDTTEGGGIFSTSIPPQPLGQFDTGDATLADKLVTYWNFEGNFNPIYNFNNSVTLVQSTHNVFGAGLIGQSFNGDNITGPSAMFNSASPLNVSSENAITLSFWLKLNSLKDGTKLLIPIKPEKGGWYVEYTNSGRIKFGSYRKNSVSSSRGVVADNKWHHYVITYNNKTVTMYRDGESLGSKKYNPKWVGGGRTFALSGDKNRSIRGSMDELGIWSRALSQTEVKALYNNGHGSTYTVTPAVSPSPEQSASPTVSPSPAASVVDSPAPRKLGDVDRDSDVDLFDYNTVVTNFNSTNITDPNIKNADLNENGVVDLFDFNEVVSNFGN